MSARSSWDCGCDSAADRRRDLPEPAPMSHLGGTSVIIVVGVALDTVKQLEAQMLDAPPQGLPGIMLGGILTVNLILLGAPGAGKGTLASYLVEKMGVPTRIHRQYSARSDCKTIPSLARRLSSLWTQGSLYRIGACHRHAASEPHCARTTARTASFWTASRAPSRRPRRWIRSQRSTARCSLEVPDEVIEGRMTGRRVCLKCGASYHIKANPPRQAGHLRCVRRQAAHPQG